MQSQSTLTTATAAPWAADRTRTLTAALFAALLGTVIVWGVGFSHASVLHNAAHDVRHSNGFPCH
jgi:cobalt transporter subunit CbtB